MVIVLPCGVQDNQDFLYKGMDCEEYLQKNAQTKCDKLRESGGEEKKVYEWCPKTCGEKANLGECAN